MANTNGNNRRLLLGGGVGLLLGFGGIAAVLVADGRITPNGLLLAQMGPGGPGVPGTPGRPGAVRPGAPGNPPRFGNSFDGAPPSYPGGGGGGAAPGGLPGGMGGMGGYGAMMGGGDSDDPADQGGIAPPTGAATTAPSGPVPPKPVVKGRQASNFRTDPFVSRRFPIIEKTPAYNFISTERFARYIEPPRPKRPENPEIEFGPLPFVPRRVAGVLFNGSTSAILETAGGQDIRVVQPGERVPSGIPGIPELTVSSISPSQITLRADDGRTVSVALSGSASAQGAETRGTGFPGGGNFPGGGRGGVRGGGGGGAVLGGDQ